MVFTLQPLSYDISFLIVTFQLSDLSGSRPSSWRFPRLNLPASHRDWQRSAHTYTHIKSHTGVHQLLQRIHVYTDLFLFADLSEAGDENRHWHADFTVWEDGQRHPVLHQHTAGGCHCEGKSVWCMSTSVVCNVIISQYVLLCVQFLHGRGLKQVNTKTIQCVSVGQKDQNKGLFHLWQEIFQLPRTKRYRTSCLAWNC